MPNVYRPEFDQDLDRPPFRWRRALVGRQAGADKLGASLYELEPGASTFPLHAHHANEELIVVLSGRPTLRTPDGERELPPGEVVACPAGRAGAHRIDNHSDAPATILIVSTMVVPDVNEFPDTGRVWARTADRPGADAADNVQIIGVPSESVDVFQGEA